MNNLKAPLVGLVTLGCAKNEVDSEYMLAGLDAAGFSQAEELSEAEAIVINTCAFILPAREESIETILEAARYKETGRCKVLAVVGCMAQRYRAELEKELPEVDLFIGVDRNEQGQLGELIARALGSRLTHPRGTPPFPRLVQTATQGWAYLKISEGCNNRCSYCAIPLIRGGLVSRPYEELVREARYLESLGALELNLIAQDVTAYGTDRRGESTTNLVRLLELLLNETSIPWVRLLYTHPAHLDESLLTLVAREERILPYLDIPVQHASDRVLERMGRGVARKEIERKIELARRIIGDPVLRTTVMVGFPCEGPREFEELLDFIDSVRFDRVGGFIYSPEEGTAAYSMGGKIPMAEKERRLEEVLELQREISAELNAERVGRTVPVLVERELDPDEAPSPEYLWAARSKAHAPEVDGCVYLEGDFSTAPGIVQARIIGSDDYDLFAAVSPFQRE